MIPEGWQVRKQGEIAEFSNGRAYKLTEWEKEGTPVIRLQNLTGSGKDYYFSNLKLPERQYCEYGDLLYMWSATFGPYIWKGERAIYHYHIWKVTCDEMNLTKLFLYHLLGYQTSSWMGISNGMGILHVTKGNMEDMNLLLPPLPEQEKIAAILTSVDGAIEKQEAQIDKLQSLKKAMMQELLAKGIGHTEFKDSPVGKIPKGWEVVHVSDIGKVKGGKRMPKGRAFSDRQTKHPYIRVTDFSNGTVSLLDLKYVHPEDREKIKRYIISKDDLYVSIAGSIGLVGTIPAILDGAQLTENAAKVVLDRATEKNFLKYLLQSDLCQNQFLQEIGTGGGVPKLALFRIEKTIIPLPLLSEQQQIAAILTSVDGNIESKQQKLAHTKSLKKSLMQDLLTGKVRVNV